MTSENTFSYHYLQRKTYESKLRMENVNVIQPLIKCTSIFPCRGDIKWIMTCYVEPEQEIRGAKKHFALCLSVDLEKKETITAELQIDISGNNFLTTDNAVTFEHRETKWSMTEELDKCIDRDGSVTVICKVRVINPKPPLLGDPVPICQISQDLEKVTIECSDQKELKAHRAVLAARSPVFAAMFSHDSLEAQSGRIVVSDVASEGMAAMLEFMYAGQIPSQPSELAETILAADKYELPDLKTTCERELVWKISVQNAASLLALTAEKQQLAPLSQYLLRFIKANIHEVIETDGWADLAINCPQVVAGSQTFSSRRCCTQVGSVLPHSNLFRKTYEFQWRIENIALAEPSFVFETTFPVSGDIKWTLKHTVEIRGSEKCLVLYISVDLENKGTIAADVSIDVKNGCGCYTTAPFKFEHQKSKWSTSNGLYFWVDSDGCVNVNCVLKVINPKPMFLEDELPPCTFSRDFETMLSSGNFSDVTIECSDQKELKAHRAVLAARSPVFAAMFSHDTLEARSGRVVVTDVRSDGMRALLRFLYTGRIPNYAPVYSGRTPFDVSELVQTIVAADKYELPDLKAVCERQLVENTNGQNVASVLAATIGKQQLAPVNQLLLRLIKENLQEVIETEGWTDLAINHPQVIADLNERRRRHLGDASDDGSSASEAKRRCLETRKDTT